MAQPKKTIGDIITTFELQVSDVTELSGSEEIEIANRVHLQICNEKPWIFLRKAASGSVSTDGTNYYLTLPSDFGYIAANDTYTDNMAPIYNNASPTVIFMGTNRSPLQVVNFADRFQYANRNNVAYIDIVNNQIVFPSNPNISTYQFDYICVPPVLGINDYPIFPGQFHDIMVFGMAMEDSVLQLSPKATSYMPENSAKYEQWLADMKYWDAQFNLS